MRAMVISTSTGKTRWCSVSMTERDFCGKGLRFNWWRKSSPANRLMHHLVVDELMLIPVKQDTNCDCLTNRGQRVFKFRNNVLGLSSWNILMMDKRRSFLRRQKVSIKGLESDNTLTPSLPANTWDSLAKLVQLGSIEVLDFSEVLSCNTSTVKVLSLIKRLKKVTDSTWAKLAAVVEMLVSYYLPGTSLAEPPGHRE